MDSSNPIEALLEKALVPLLKPVLDPLHRFLDGVPPIGWTFSVCGFLILGSLWVLFLKKESIFRGAPVHRPQADLRIWVCVLIVPYLLIYLFI